jgi:hypothetical protein
VSFDAFSALRRIVKHDRNQPGSTPIKKGSAIAYGTAFFRKIKSVS